MKKLITKTIVLLFSLQVIGQDHSAFVEKLDKDLPKELKRNKVSAASISIIIDNETILNKGYGLAERESEVKATASTQYAIGSVSKLVTATAVLKLYSEGLIDIDKPYTDYVPDFSMKKHFTENIPITPRHLLAHYGGLPRLQAKGFLLKSPLPLERILAYSKESYLIAPPGKVYQYSDWGTDLLALLVQRVSGQPYEQFVKDEIFKPLGMENSEFGPVASTKSYMSYKPVPTYEYSFPGSDGVKSTSEDLGRLGQMYINEGKVMDKIFIKPSFIAEAMTPQFQAAELGMDESRGFMLDVRSYRGVRFISKGGIHEPYYTTVYLIPDYHAVVAVASNSNASSLIHSTVLIETILYLKKKYGEINPLSYPEKPVEKVKLTADELSKLEGNYSTDLGLMNLKWTGTKFSVKLTKDGDKGIGIPYSDNTIRLKGHLLGLIPIKLMDIHWIESGDEIVVGERRNSGRKNVGGVKIPNHQIHQSWKDAIGTYHISNYSQEDYKTFDKIELSINEDGVLEVRGKISYPQSLNFQLGLLPLNDEQAKIPGYSFDYFGGETIHKKKIKGKEVLVISGYEFTKMN